MSLRLAAPERGAKSPATAVPTPKPHIKQENALIRWSVMLTPPSFTTGTKTMSFHGPSTLTTKARTSLLKPPPQPCFSRRQLGGEADAAKSQQQIKWFEGFL